ncbi:hypothetical protein C8R43DRAFT_550393 [Mycena crocata]|nr:hypothetical protein C8R43DRAFT_550393 [Mycena crocata]
MLFFLPFLFLFLLSITVPPFLFFVRLSCGYINRFGFSFLDAMRTRSCGYTLPPLSSSRFVPSPTTPPFRCDSTLYLSFVHRHYILKKKEKKKKKSRSRVHLYFVCLCIL